VAIEGQGVGADILTPEGFIEAAAQKIGLPPEGGGAVVISKLCSNLRGGALGAIDIALHFAERDRRLGERAIGMEDRIVAVLPALIHKSGRRLAIIFDKAVTVAGAIKVGAAQRA